jgi:hypothetical protein
MEFDDIFGKHQPGGTGMVCQHELSMQGSVHQSKRFKQMKLLALLLQSDTCDKDCGHLQTLHQEGKGT